MSQRSEPAPALALYVYFRAHADRDAAVRQALERLRRTVRAEHGVDVELRRRPELRDGARTWMEVYEPLGEAQCSRLLAALPGLAERTGLSPLVEGGRHVERFEALALPQ